MLCFLNGCGGVKESFIDIAGTSWRHQPFEDTDVLPSVDLLENL